MITIQKYIGKLAKAYADKTVLENNQSLVVQHAKIPNDVSQFALVYAVNNNENYIAKCLYSILTYKQHNADVLTDIYIIVDDTFKYEQKILNMVQDVKFVHVDAKLFSDIKVTTRRTIAAYYRLVLFRFDVFEHDYDNILYVDCDTEFACSIQNLMQIQFEQDKFFGWVIERDLMNETDQYFKTQWHDIIRNQNQCLDIPKDNLKFYCNSGVFLLKQRIFKQLTKPNEFFDILIEISTTNGLKNPDQDVLNYVCSSEQYSKFVQYIPSNYNHQQWCRYKKCHIDDAIIIHHPTNEQYNYYENNNFIQQFQSKILQTKCIDINDVIKNSYMICEEKHHKDRILLEKALFKFHNIPFPNIFKGGTDKGECKSPTLNSYLKLVEFAKQNKLPFFLQFEDDAYPCDSIMKKLRNIFEHIPYDANWIQLGYTEKQMRTLDCPMQRITQDNVPGNHATLVFESAYDDIIKLLKQGHHSDRIAHLLGGGYVVKNPLFLQYNFDPAVWKNSSYWIYNFSNKDKQFVVKNYTPIELILNDESSREFIPEDQISKFCKQQNKDFLNFWIKQWRLDKSSGFSKMNRIQKTNN